MSDRFPKLTCPSCKESDQIVGRREVNALWYEVLCLCTPGDVWQKAVESEPMSLEWQEQFLADFIAARDATSI